MKYIQFFITLVLFSIAARGQEVRTAIVRNDNDYITFDDHTSMTEKVPFTLQQKFQSIVNRPSNVTNEEKHTACYKIFINDTLSVYVLIIREFSQQTGYLFCYDSLQKKLTENPITLNLKWAENGEDGFMFKLLDYPLAQFHKDGLLYLKERVHNGNSYNAVITKIYSLQKNLSYSLVGCFESKSRITNGQTIRRVLQGNTIYAYLDTDTTSMYLGKTIIDFDSKKIISKECKVESMCPSLYTSSGEDEEKILKNGYPFSY